MRTLATLSLSLLAACGGDEDASGKPNIVIVTLDTTRPDYLSCYSSARGGTPTLQGLSDRGVRFEAALSSSGVTPVSHATILTGAFPYEHGVRVLSAGSGFKLAEEQPTIASLLRDEGYFTAAIQSAFPVSSYFGFDKDYDLFLDLTGEMQISEAQGKTVWEGDVLQRRSDETAFLVLDFLAGDERGDRPFFLWLHLWDPHDPWLVPPQDQIAHLQIRPETHMQANTPLYSKIYQAEIKYMDSQLGVVLDGLKKHGIEDSTLICVTADHGEGLTDGFASHGWAKHRMTYQQQIHVPFLLAGPGVKSGVVVEDMVRTADIVPTLLDFAGLGNLSTGGSGRSVRPLAEGSTLETAIAYADQVNGYDANASMVRNRPDAAFLYTVCDGTWKLIYRPHMFERSELFNLEQDPTERRNVIEEHPAEFLRLMNDLSRRNPWVLDEFPVDADALDPDAAKALEGMGYVGGEGGDTGDWWWCCPAHPDYRRDSRLGEDGSALHGEDGCSHPVVPRTVFTPK